MLLLSLHSILLLSSLDWTGSGDQPSQTKIVNNVFHFLYAVLETIASSSQVIILQIEKLETSEHILDEP